MSDLESISESFEMQLPHLDFKKEEASMSSMASFRSLLAQNEDLAARLRASMQKLVESEMLQARLKKENEQTESQRLSLSDQILIWREKEKIWKDKESRAEKLSQERFRALEIESSLLRQKSSQFDELQERIERLTKYQQKIKTIVKPYVNQLKAYTKSLFQQTQEQHQALLSKEAELQKAQKQQADLLAELETQKAKADLDRNEIFLMFEDERDGLKSEIRALSGENEILQEKTRNFDRSLDRQDELENLLVALRRSKDETLSQLQTEAQSTKARLSDQDQELQYQKAQNEDLRAEIAHLKEMRDQTELNIKDLRDQLTGLRYMWTQKSQENENLKISIQSLEKINLDLSQKLNSLRQDLEVS